MSLPLEGYRAVDFGWVAAAPVMGMVLAVAGAEVIKVETRGRWDTSRFTPDNTSGNPNKDPWFHCLNRGKLSVTLNLTQPKAIDIAKQLIAESDIVIENFAPGVIKRFGLDYDSLKQIKHDIIMISMSACGQYGPFSNIVAYGPSLNGLGGVDSLVGYEDGRVLGMQQAFADFNAPLHGLVAVLAALHKRKSTGEGHYIDLAQLEALICTIGEPVMEYTMNGHVLGTVGNHEPNMAPHNNYPCKGNDKWVSIAIKTEEEWHNFCRAVGSPAWCRESRFSDLSGRQRNEKELDELIAGWTMKHADYEVMEIMQQAGVAAVPCMDMEERYFDHHFQQREIFHTVSDSEGDPFVLTDIPFRISGVEMRTECAAPMIGEHNDYVFRELLGLESDEIRRLEEEKVIF